MAFRAFTPLAVTVREGPVAVKKAGLFSSWRGWSEKWVVLTATNLTIHSKSSSRLSPDSGLRISLNGITRMERTHSSRRGHCLLLDAGNNHKFYLAFGSDEELYSWHDAIYSISPLTMFKANDGNTEIDLEDIIRGYELDSPDLSSRPSTAQTMPRIKPQGIQQQDLLPPAPLFRPATHSPASSRQLDFDELRGLTTRSSNVQFAHSVPVLRIEGLTTEERGAIRKAVSLLCDLMEPRLLRKSEPGGEKPFDLVEIRLRSLSRLRRKWNKQETSDESDAEEKETFAAALRDGYVLCQLLNTLHPSAVVRPDVRGQDYNSSLNINKFLTACVAHGLPSTELFLPDDLIEASGYSLARVASTILALVQMNESSPQTNPSTTLPEPAQDQVPVIQMAAEDLEKWVEHFMALTRQRILSDQLASDPAPVIVESESEFLDSKVYQHLISFISQIEQTQDERFRTIVERLGRFMASLDPVWSLVQSSQLRIKLLKISTILGVSNQPRLREALKKDDGDIATLFKSVISSEEQKKAVLRLKGESAQNCVDLIQDLLDKGSLQSADDEGFTLKARRLLVKLSEASDTLPSSLYIRGVSRIDKEATFGGTFGDIYRCSYKGQDVALKRIRVFQRDSARHKIRQNFCREALLWQRLDNPFVLPFIGMDAESFPSFLCMVSPWMRHGTILKHLQENGNANVERRLFEIAQGLAYLHSQDIIHGDLRGSNILVDDDDWHARLADFGLAVFSDATAATHTSHRGGSVRWMSPELHYPQSCGLDTFKRTFASDVYSFALVCVELYSGKPPFPEISHDAAVMLRVMAGERPSRPYDVSGDKLMPDALWKLVQQCWSHSPFDRPTMSRVVEMMQEGSAELRLESSAPAFLSQLPKTPPGKPPYLGHRPSRRRLKGQAILYPSLSF